jgi:hypothetical protein
VNSKYQQILNILKSIYTRAITVFNKFNRKIITIISICISLAILGILVYRQREVLFTFEWQFRPIPIILTFLLFSFTLFWAAIVWGWILNSLGSNVEYIKHVRYYLISNLAKRIPGTIWYIAGRFQLYAADGVNKNITAVASGIEMILITLAGILLVLAISTKTVIQYYHSPLFLILIFIVGIVILHPKVIRWVMKKRKIEAKSINYFFIVKGICFYVLSWIVGGILLFEIGNIIYPIANTFIIYFINSWVLVGVISTILFFSPSNFGVTEIGLSLLLSNIIPSSIAVIIAIAARIIIILIEITWTGLFLLITHPQKNRLTQKD